MKNWIIATRPWSFPVSSMSVLISGAYLYWRGWDVSWLIILWAVFGIILFHAAGNLISDWYDFKKGIDAEDTFGSKTLTDGLLTPKQVLVFGIVMLVLGIINGLGIMLVTGWWLLLFGGLGALLTLLYPWMKSHALGDFDIFLEYGIIPALGTAYAATGGLLDAALFADVLWVVPAFVTITVAVLHTNNTRDTFTDKRAGIKTFAMLIGREHSIALYIVEIVFPIIWVLMLVAAGRMPWLALAVVALILVLRNNCKQAVLFEKDPHAMDFLDEMTAKLQLMNGILLTLTLVASKLISLI